MYIYLFIILFFVLLFILNKNVIEKYTDLWDSMAAENNIKKITDGLFKGFRDATKMEH